MNRKFRRVLLVLGVSLFVVGCNPTVRVEIVTQVPAAQAERPGGAEQVTPPRVSPSRTQPMPPQPAAAPSAELAPTRGSTAATALDVQAAHSLADPEAIPQDTVTILPGPSMAVARTWHTVTFLTDGRILLVGGSQATQSANDYPTTVETYDPKSGKMKEVSPLLTGRGDHTATRLRDGRVLVVGGATNGSVAANDAEIYDPVSDTWTVVQPLFPHGNRHMAALMKDGRVLVVGGGPGPGVLTGRVEIFDPKTDTWSEARSLSTVRSNATAQLLKDGRVLVIGGNDYGDITPPEGDAVLYDPTTDTWTPTGPMIDPRIYAASVRLLDGRVMVVGGMAVADIHTGKMTNSVEIYDPATNRWSATGAMAQPRGLHAVVAYPDGRVMALGGESLWAGFYQGDYMVREIELYNPVSKRWHTVGTLPSPRIESVAVRLPNGNIWLTGGRLNDETYFADTWFIGVRRVPPSPPGKDMTLEPPGQSVITAPAPTGE